MTFRNTASNGYCDLDWMKKISKKRTAFGVLFDAGRILALRVSDPEIGNSLSIPTPPSSGIPFER